MATGTATAQAPDRRAKGRSVIIFLLSLAVAAQFLLAAYPKLTSDPGMVGAFNIIGLGQWFRYFTGVVEVVGSLLLFLPRLSRLGALLLACTMVGAIIAHLTKLGGFPWQAIELLVLSLLIARMRKKQQTA